MLEYVTTLFEQKEIKNINLLVNDIDEKVCKRIWIWLWIWLRLL